MQYFTLNYKVFNNDFVEALQDVLKITNTAGVYAIPPHKDGIPRILYLCNIDAADVVQKSSEFVSVLTDKVNRNEKFGLEGDDCVAVSYADNIEEMIIEDIDLFYIDKEKVWVTY